MLLGLPHIQITVGEIAASTARNTNFFCQALGMVNDQHAQAERTGLRGAKQACRASANYDGIECGKACLRLQSV